MIKIEILHPLLVGIATSEGGISSYFLSQKMKMPEQRVRYYLNEAVKDGFVEKTGPKYKITNDVFIQNGFGVVYDKKNRQFSFIGCQHYGTCPCTGVITENCNLLKDLKTMPIVKKFLKDKQKLNIKQELEVPT